MNTRFYPGLICTPATAVSGGSGALHSAVARARLLDNCLQWVLVSVWPYFLSQRGLPIDTGGSCACSGPLRHPLITRFALACLLAPGLGLARDVPGD